VRDRQVQVSQGSTVIGSYDYDADGRLRMQNDEGVKYFVYDQTSRLQEFAATGDGIGKYDYGSKLIRLSMAGEGQRYYSYDGLGSATALTDSFGVPKVSLHLDAWGVFRKPSELDDTQSRVGFTGYFWSKPTNLYFAKARWYDPETARFTTQDTHLGKVDNPPSLHRYFYANDNPTRYFDPTGHETMEERGARERARQADSIATYGTGPGLTDHDPSATGPRNAGAGCLSNEECGISADTLTTSDAPTPQIVTGDEPQPGEEEGPLGKGTNAFTRPLVGAANKVAKKVGQVTGKLMGPIDRAEKSLADQAKDQAEAWGKKKLQPAEHGALEGQRKALEGTGIADPHADIAREFQATGGQIAGAGAAGWVILNVEAGKFILTDAAGNAIGAFADRVSAETALARFAEGAEGSSGRRILNLGSGGNPMAGAINLDARALQGVNVVGDAEVLPFGAGTFDEVVAINPKDYTPLADAGRVLKPGGRMTVVGQKGNYELRQLRRLSDEHLAEFGFKRVNETWVPAEERFKVGTFARTDGTRNLNPDSFYQITLERIQQ
jgi:RHS repeat-associated protein